MKGVPAWLIVVAKFLLAGLAAIAADQSAGGPVAGLLDGAARPALGAEVDSVPSSFVSKLRAPHLYVQANLSA